MTVWSAVLDALFWCVGLLLPLSVPPELVGDPVEVTRLDLWVPPVHSVQNTVSQVSQNNSS